MAVTQFYEQVLNLSQFSVHELVAIFLSMIYAENISIAYLRYCVDAEIHIGRKLSHRRVSIWAVNTEP
jgi:hypothetical protein